MSPGASLGAGDAGEKKAMERLSFLDVCSDSWRFLTLKETASLTPLAGLRSSRSLLPSSIMEDADPARNLETGSRSATSVRRGHPAACGGLVS